MDEEPQEPSIVVGVERLTNSIEQRVAEYVGRHRETVNQPSESDIALVLRGLADHTSIVWALQHRPDPTSPWPHATSLGRWYHDMADEFERRARN